MTKPAAYFGLTGGIASGKTACAGYLAELGARIVDADRIGHDLLLSSGAAYNEIVEAFGESVLDAGREVDRRRLGALVFSDAAKLSRLNAVLHPRIIRQVEETASRLRAENPQAVVIVDAALIFESGIGGHFSKIIVAWCRPEQQVERLIGKNGFSREEAEQRIRSQMPAEEKRRRADFVIDTSGSIEETARQVQALFPKLQQLAGK